jgi:hypothetical protein
MCCEAGAERALATHDPACSTVVYGEHSGKVCITPGGREAHNLLAPALRLHVVLEGELHAHLSKILAAGSAEERM